MSSTTEKQTEGVIESVSYENNSLAQSNFHHISPEVATRFSSKTTQVEHSSACASTMSRKTGTILKKRHSLAKSSLKGIQKPQANSTLSSVEWLKKSHVLPDSSAERALLQGVLRKENEILKSLIKTLKRDIARKKNFSDCRVAET